MGKTLRERGCSAQEEATGSVQQVFKRRQPDCKATQGHNGTTAQSKPSTGIRRVTVRKCRPQDESTLGGKTKPSFKTLLA